MDKITEKRGLYRGLPAGIAANILRLNIIKFSKWFSLVMPVIVPFYKENGLSLGEIMLLKSVYSVVIVVMELPSGYMADVLGRRMTLVCGAILSAAGFATYSLSAGYAGFLIAEIALGAGHSFISGADSAMLYDTLAAGRREKDYTRYEGLNTSVGNFSEAVAGLAGGALALISLRFPFYLQFIIAASAIPATLTLREPGKKNRRRSTGIRDLFGVIEKIIFRDKKLRYNLLFSSLIGATTLFMAWFAQPMFEKAGVRLAFYGILWTALNITVGVSSIAAHKVEKKLGETRTLTLIALFIPALMILTGLLPLSLAIPLLFLFYLFRGLATPVLKDYVNQHTSPDVRATVMSLRDMIIRIFFAFFAPLGGWLADNYDLSAGLIVSGFLVLLLSLATLVMFIRNRSVS